ncbi:bifunctional helix-turn-helix transcriptional regulator/GNAT family N-acetyltransferase [Halostella sp. PRR32]|uniref:bifunctional helix-turn-helix transcriptional regulator/GNAT family N-acetyltransferase n=1 Tax=Halostella sp. PRR32 TaxID=3098147 RepID=UPI002B1D48CC|nr:bifunctional helix-turn-helix transcriptional regulator/GNAT family N-acetyltransferase [Halostella sp. PRR32]
MELTGEFEFGHEDRSRIYDHVERHGSIDPKRLRKALDIDPRGFGHHVAILKRDGVVEEVDGELRIAFEDADEEEFRADGVDCTIRQARQEDLTGLVGAIRDVAEEGTYIEAETVADVIDHEEVLLRHNELESRIFFVATVNDDVVGWVHLDVPEVGKLAHTAELTVGVLDEYRGRGIGNRLLDRGVDWADENGYEKIYNSIPATNQTAVDFLESNEWETEAVREDHYKVDGRYVDEVMLARRL